jgi:hypothetical protein
METSQPIVTPRGGLSTGSFTPMLPEAGVSKRDIGLKTAL